MDDIKIGLARDKDVDAIGNISQQVSLIHYQNIENEFKKPDLVDQKNYIRKSLAEKNVRIIKAEIGETICGYLVLYINTYPDKYFIYHQRGFVGSIGVDEKCRRRGVGKSLLAYAEQLLKEQNIKILEIDVYTFNEHAEKLYDNFGFEDIKHYKRKFI